MKASVIQFPGSNCDQETAWFLEDVLGAQVSTVWHQETTLPLVDIAVLPGGFSYGDYVRSGAIAAHSPIISALRQHAKQGRRILGICNGFQILLEAGFLPGSLLDNHSCLFLHHWVMLRCTLLGQDIPCMMPIAHAHGRYDADRSTLQRLHDDGGIVLRYQDAEDINGSLEGIAGIMSSDFCVLGMMPHPERSFHASHRGQGGRDFLKALFH